MSLEANKSTVVERTQTRLEEYGPDAAGCCA
jgi:hypothetical protein